MEICCKSCWLCLRVAILLLTFSGLTFAHWKDHYRYHRGSHADANARRRRQTPTQIDLNITVPFIFSARLYPYGSERNDTFLKPQASAQAVVLQNDFTFFQEKHSVVYILRDGAIAFASNVTEADRSVNFPRGPKIIALYWAPIKLGNHGRVYFRESTDVNVLNLAKSEVQIQYQYGDDFKPKSVLIVTWENVSPLLAPDDLSVDKTNTFQVAIIISDNGTFAHVVYSKLKWNNNAVAGFNEGQSNGYFSFPGSGTPRSIMLANESDIGIPGEWLFKIDDARIYLCGPGFKGLECINKCDPGEWFYDCSRKCHCAPTIPPTDHAPCNIVNGHCANGQCRDGWENPPVCDIDVDECEERGSKALCPNAQPDCINTPGAYLCMCLTGYDNATNQCLGSDSSGIRPAAGTVSVIPLQPRLVVNTPSRGLVISVPRRPKGPSGTPSLVVNTPKTIIPQLVNQWPFVTKNTGSKPPVTVPTVIQAAADSDDDSTGGFKEEPVVIKECTLQCGENAECKQRHNGDQLCVCNEGWSGDGHFCVDVNECFLDNACAGGARCHNTLGSYTCQCDQGFESDGNECVDIDECGEGLAQCPDVNSSMCVNTIGSYECRCRPGFNGNPSSLLGCIDINECLIPEFYCGPNADCKNTHGGFRCHCHDGYRRNADSTGCEDIDECAIAPCDKAAVCHNTKGAYTCTCLQGYSGDGFTCQGMVSFNEPLQSYENQPLTNMNYVALAPLYLNTDLTLGGNVYFKETNEFSTLTRGTLNVQEDFNESGFRGKSVFIVTFENLVSKGSNFNSGVNTFQLVLVYGDDGTYASFIYDDISKSTAQAGLINHDFNEVYELPSSGAVAHRLSEQSNIGQQGKWMFKVDESTIIRCPSGVMGAPFCQEACQPGLWGKNCAKVCRCAAGIPCDFQTGFCPNKLCQPGFTGPSCQQDIDECTSGQHLCDPEAQCTNTEGAYSCSCREGLSGDGMFCFELDPCLGTFGTPCSPLGSCIISDHGQPSCICNEGYSGDGFSCLLPTTAKETTTTKPKTTASVRQKAKTVVSTTRKPTVKPRRKQTKAPKSKPTTAPSTKKATIIDFTTTTTKPQPITVERKTTTKFVWPTFRPTTRRPPIIYNRITTAPPRRRPPSFGSTPRTDTPDTPDEIDNNIISAVGVLVIIIPAVLCGVWLILIVVLLVVCLRRRKQRQREKYGLGYYHPPTSSKAASQVASTSNGAYTPSAYGSSWTIPRPTYDYYQGTYYPDPYSPYKYT